MKRTAHNERRLPLSRSASLALLLAAMPALAAEVDISKLPPPVSAKVDFARNIRPIFEASCLRCHGPQRPKSGFRLDNREAALKGGENNVDIVPGASAKSPLIHYVARLVQGMEMPPGDKGEPLSPQQVGLLRAWIDQGATWDTAAPTNITEVTLAPMVGGTSVNGDSHKFREQYWRTDGFDGGIEKFDLYEQLGPDTKVSLSGRSRVDDSRVAMELERTDLGFVHAGWEQYRKYYDDTGGAFGSSAGLLPVSLGSDLYLDIGKAWLDLGLILPRWPRIVLGYEHDYRAGQEAITSWGAAGPRADSRNVAPESRRIDEGVDILKFDLDTEVQGVAIQDRFRGEFYKLSTRYTNVASRGFITQDAREKPTYFQGANSLRLEKQFEDWLFGSGGYFYSHLNADDSFADTTTSGGRVLLATVPHIVLERESHVFNLNGLVGPFDGFTAATGVQSEWTHQNADGAGNLNGIAYTLPPGNNLSISPATLASEYAQSTVSETVDLRYTKLPFTTLFTDLRFEQESIGQSDSDLQPGASFLENPSFSSQASDVRAGFTTSPWQRATFSAHYRRYENDSSYKTNQPPQPSGGYPGMLEWRNWISDEAEAKLVVRASSWIRTTLSYQFVQTDYKLATRTAYDLAPPTVYSPGGGLLAGHYASHVYGLGAVLTPFARVSFNGSFSYQATRTTTASDGYVPPYEGGTYSGLAGANWLVDAKTDLSVNYSMSLADYSESNAHLTANSPPPLGIRYQQHGLQIALSRQIHKNLSAKLQYGFYLYDEPTAGGVNDYTAHTIFATLDYHFP